MQHNIETINKKLNNPEPCRVPEGSEIGQGSGREPDNDGVRNVLHQHNDQQVEAGGSVHGITVPCGNSRSVKSK